MKKRNVIRSIAAGIFCVGVLLGGIGTGMVISDFSAFTYYQLKAPDEEFETEIFTYQIQPNESGEVWVRRLFGEGTCTLSEKNEIPEKTVQVKVVYNSQLCTPNISEEWNGDEESWLKLYLNYHGSTLGNYMKYKEQFLEGLKRRELWEYQEEYVRSVEVLINPADREQIRVDW